MGEEFRISGAAATSHTSDPAVVHNQTKNHYLIVWSDGRNGATRGSDIYGRRAKANGDLKGKDFRISDWDATATESFPALAYNPTDNQYLAAWEDSRNAAKARDNPTPRDIYGQRITG